MSSLRQVSNSRENLVGHGQSALGNGNVGRNKFKDREMTYTTDPEALCVQCKHQHLNKNCFRQHPELKKRRKPARSKSKKMAAKAAGANGCDDSDEASSDIENDGTSLGMIASVASKFNNRLLYDTGASHHFIKCQDSFVSLKKLKRPFEFDQAVGNSSLTYGGISRVQIGSVTLDLKNSLYSPNSACNIVSAVRLNKDYGIVATNRNQNLIQNLKGEEILIAKLVPIEGVLFIEPLDSKTRHTANSNIAAPGVARIPKVTSAQRWHQRLGHVGQEILKKTAVCSLGLEGMDISDLGICETCHLSKAQRFVSREPRPIPGQPLDEIFIDTVGKLPESLNGLQYAVILTDAKTRMRWVLMTKGKDEITSQLLQWIDFQYNQYGKRIRVIFRDGGTEFIRAKEQCDKMGIRTDVSAPHTPEQNGVAEAANKVLLRRARSMLIDAGMPPCFWPWALEHSCFITNRLYCLRTKKVPVIDFLEGLAQPHNEKIDFSLLPRFGCRAYKLIEPKPGKFEARAEQGWFLGFQKNTNKNYLVYHPHLTPKQGFKWVESFTPHVTFNEDVVFGDMLSSVDQQKTRSYWTNTTDLPLDNSLTTSIPVPLPKSQIQKFEGEINSSILTQKSTSEQPNALESQSRPESAPIVPAIPPVNRPPLVNKKLDVSTLKTIPTVPTNLWLEKSTKIDGTEVLPEPTSPQVLNNDFPPGPPSSVESEYDSSDEHTSEVEEPEVVRNEPNNLDSTSRELIRQEENNALARVDDDKLQDKYDQIMTGWDAVAPIAGHKRNRSPDDQATRSKRGRPIKRLDYHKLHHGKAGKEKNDPKTWTEAMQSVESNEWKVAADEEIRSLRDTGTIKIIDRSKLPKGRTLMKTKWVFKRKYHADGTLEKYRARCTVKGYTQKCGIDYTETFAPTPRSETGRIMLALAHKFGWYRRQGDVPTAFLNPDLDLDLYMELPEGYKKDNKIILIKKGLYGLKQAAALWYDDIKSFLATQGMFQTMSDMCLYTNKQKDLFAILHVDDIQILGPSKVKVDKLMEALHMKYKLKSVKTDMFLGIHISTPRKNVLKLSQGQYATKLLERHGLSNCKTAASPMERLMEPSNSVCSPQSKFEYNSMIGGLQYLANNTRPDIAHSVNHLARFLTNPSDEHIKAARRVLRYIAKDIGKGIEFINKPGKPVLEAYSDADFAGDPATSRSTSGCLIRLSSGPVSWKSHLQKNVVLSTTEAEYLAATETCRQLQWTKSLLGEIGLSERVEGSRRTNLYVDNQSAISLIKNHDNHKRSKHIALRNHYCREQFNEGAISVIYVESKNQLADSLTKVKSLIGIQ